MSNHKYILQPYKGLDSRGYCLQCKHRDKTFSQYINVETGEPLADNVGRCNREDKCGYHYTPKQYFTDNNISSPLDNVSQCSSFQMLIKKKQEKPEKKPVSYTSFDYFKQSLRNYKQNNLISFLHSRLNIQLTKELIEKYFIGTSSYWKGAVIFWQIDEQGKIRAGKVMLHNSQTGKRVKDPFNISLGYIKYYSKTITIYNSASLDNICSKTKRSQLQSWKPKRVL